MAFGEQGADLLDEPRDFARVVGIAFDQQIVPLRPDANVEQVFEVPQVVVIGSKSVDKPSSRTAMRRVATVPIAISPYATKS